MFSSFVPILDEPDRSTGRGPPNKYWFRLFQKYSPSRASLYLLEREGESAGFPGKPGERGTASSSEEKKREPAPASPAFQPDAPNERAGCPSGLFQFYFEQRLRNHVYMRGNQTGMLHVYMSSLLDIREGTFSSIHRISRRRGNLKRVLPAVSGISMSHPVLRDRVHLPMDRKGPAADFGNCTRCSNR